MTVVESWTHGESAYQYRRCRCDHCRTAHNRRIRDERLARHARPIPADVVHGLAAYGNWRCRCDICITAMNEYVRQRRARAKTPAVDATGLRPEAVPQRASPPLRR